MEALLALTSKHGPEAFRQVGDGICAFFKNPRAALECALSLRRAFDDYAWDTYDLPRLLPRIVLHAGGYLDRGTDELHGRAKILPKRLEPKVPAGDIWATESFAIRLGDFSSLEQRGEAQLTNDAGVHLVYRVIAPRRRRTSHSRGAGVRAAALELVHAGDPEQRLAALDALGSIRGKGVRSILEQTARNIRADFADRRMALLSLEEHGDPASTQTLIDITPVGGEDLPTIRALALQVLGAVGDLRALPHLVRHVDRVLKNKDKRNEVSLDLAERALLGLRHFSHPMACDAVQRSLEQSSAGLRLTSVCVAAAAQPPVSAIMVKLSELATDVQRDPQVRTVALEALISVQGRHAEHSATSAGDASQQERIASLLPSHVPEELRRLALRYLAGCSTPFAQEQLLHHARATDSLAAWAIKAAAKPGISIELPESGRIARDGFETLDGVVRAELETKERGGSSGNRFSPRSWPRPRRPGS